MDKNHTTIIVVATQPLPNPASRYLWGRDIHVVEANQLDQLTGIMRKFPLSPIFISVQWRRAQTKDLLQQHPLSHPLVMYFSEEDSHQSYADLKTLPTQECFFAPLSGPAIERIIRSHEWDSPNLIQPKARPEACLPVIKAKLAQIFDHRRTNATNHLPLSQQIQAYCFLTETGPQSYLIATSHTSEKGSQIKQELLLMIESIVKVTSGKNYPSTQLTHQLVVGWAEQFITNQTNQYFEDFNQGHRWLIAYKSDEQVGLRAIPSLQDWHFLEVSAEDLPVGLVFNANIYVQFNFQKKPTILITKNESLSQTKKNLLQKHGLHHLLVPPENWSGFVTAVLGHEWHHQTSLAGTKKEKLA